VEASHPHHQEMKESYFKREDMMGVAHPGPSPFNCPFLDLPFLSLHPLPPMLLPFTFFCFQFFFYLLS
jgi:hypothetical protein